MFNHRFLYSEKGCPSSHKCLIYISRTSISHSPALLKKATSYLSFFSDWKTLKPKLRLRDISSEVEKSNDTLRLSVSSFPLIFNVKCLRPSLSIQRPPEKRWRFFLPGECSLFYSISAIRLQFEAFKTRPRLLLQSVNSPHSRPKLWNYAPPRPHSVLFIFKTTTKIHTNMTTKINP